MADQDPINIPVTLDTVNATLKAGDFRKTMRELGETSKAIGKMGGEGFEKMGEAIGQTTEALRLGHAALKLFNGGLVAIKNELLDNPLFLLAAAIAGVVVAIGAMKKADEEASKKFVEHRDEEIAKIDEEYQHQKKMYELQGKSTKELEKQAFIDKRTQLMMITKEHEDAVADYLSTAKKGSAKEKAVNDSFTKEQLETYKKAKEEIKKLDEGFTEDLEKRKQDSNKNVEQMNLEAETAQANAMAAGMAKELKQAEVAHKQEKLSISKEHAANAEEYKAQTNLQLAKDDEYQEKRREIIDKYNKKDDKIKQDQDKLWLQGQKDADKWIAEQEKIDAERIKLSEKAVQDAVMVNNLEEKNADAEKKRQDAQIIKEDQRLLKREKNVFEEGAILKKLNEDTIKQINDKTQIEVDSLNRVSKSKIDKLMTDRDTAVKFAKENGDDDVAVAAFYNDLITKETENTTKGIVKIKSDGADQVKDANETDSQNSIDLLHKQIAAVEGFANQAESIFTNLMSIKADQQAAELKSFDQAQQSRLDSMNSAQAAELNVAGLTSAQKKSIQEKYAMAEYQIKLQTYNKDLAIKKKAFEVDKKMKMSSAIISGIEAEVNALATAPFFPVGIAAGIAAAVASAAAIAKISSTTFDGGGSPPTPPNTSGINAAMSSSSGSNLSAPQVFGLGSTTPTVPGAPGTSVVSVQDINKTQKRVKVVESYSTH
jgi:hypothetical protein